MALWGSPRKTRYSGLLLVQNGCRDRYAAEFFETARAAIDLLREREPRRFAQVGARVRVLLNVPLNHLCRTTGSVWFDFDELHAVIAQEPQAEAVVFAATLSASAVWLRASTAAGNAETVDPRLSRIFMREMRRTIERRLPEVRGEIDWPSIESELPEQQPSFFVRLRDALKRLRACEDAASS